MRQWEGRVVLRRVVEEGRGLSRWPSFKAIMLMADFKGRDFSWASACQELEDRPILGFLH